MNGKSIVLGVTGSIAAYKAAEIASRLTQAGAIVNVVLTESATRFITPLTFQALTQQPVHTSLWPCDSASEAGVMAAMAHIGLADKADLILVAPASADCLARLASGMANDLLSTLILVARCPILLAPAMNPLMWDNLLTKRNVEVLRQYGHQIIEPESGRMACEHRGEGRLPTTDMLLEQVCIALSSSPKDLQGRRFLITAGPTREELDPVRYLTNYSSGKMGYELAEAALRRGAEVVLVSGPVRLTAPTSVKVENVTSTEDMFQVVSRHAPSCDVIIASAAPADFRPVEKALQKIKKQGASGMELHLIPNKDIVAHVGANKKPNQIVIAFAAETQNILTEARRKMAAKNADAIVANDVTVENAGFDVSTNIVTWITDKEEENWPLMTKQAIANRICDKVSLLLSIKREHAS